MDSINRRDDPQPQPQPHHDNEERASLLSSASLAHHFSSSSRNSRPTDKEEQPIGSTNKYNSDDIENDHRASPLLMRADRVAAQENETEISSSVHHRTLRYIRSDSMDHRVHRVGRQRNNSNSNSNNSLEQLQQQYTSERTTASCSVSTALYWLCPCWNRWLSSYDWSQFAGTDLVAGLAVGLLVVPQSLSYAALAGLPVQFGLYAALVPLAAYAGCGTSRQLSVGPVALLSLLLHSGLTGLLREEKQSGDNDSMSPEAYQTMYNQLAIQCSLLLGLIYILMGTCRLGFVCTMFLSHAVVSGFTSGAALLIASAQIKYLVGYAVAGDRLYTILQSVWINLRHFNPITFLLGGAAIAALWAFKGIDTKTHPQYKWLRTAGPLIVTGAALLLSVVLQFALSSNGNNNPSSSANNNANLRDKIPVVGPIPQGLPDLTIHLLWTPVVSDFKKLLWVVLPMVIVGFMESIAIAKQLARKHKYEIDASAELIGLGMANFLGGAFSSYPVTGSFSRSAVNNDSGAQSGLACLVTAALVGLTLTFLTPVFAQLPLFSLAAIVISGVLGLVDFAEAKYLWKANRFDFAVWLTACGGTLLAGVEVGLAIAVTVSLLLVLYESAYPQTDVLGRLPGTRDYRDQQQYPEAETYDGILIVSLRAPLYFANAQNVRERIRQLETQQQQRRQRRRRRQSGATADEIHFILLELSAVSHIDTTAMHQLDSMVEEYRSHGQELVLSNPSIKVVEQLETSGLLETIGEDLLFASLHNAVSWCLYELDQRSTALSTEKKTSGLSTDGNMSDGLEEGVSDMEVNLITAPAAEECPVPFATSVSPSVQSLERRKRRPSV